MSKSILIVCITLVLAACSAEKRQERAMKEMKAPINCAHAKGDIRALQSEKATTTDQITEGITAITPSGALLGLAGGTETTQLTVATGDYNKMIDDRIREIKATCNL